MNRHCFALFALMSLCPTTGARAEIVGQPIQRVASEDEMKASLARMVLVDQAGTKLALSALLRDGKPTLVSLWAHWCPNCKAEMTGFKAIAGACPRKWNIVFVSSRSSDYAKDLAKFKTFALPWKIYDVAKEMTSSPDNAAVLRAFLGATADDQVVTPLHYFVSANGKVDMIVNARMDFEAPQRLAAFCAD